MSSIGALAARPGLTVVLPTYNERDRLSELIEGIFDAWDGDPDAVAMGAVEIIVVDDNSPDGTGVQADILAREYRICVIHRSGRLGLGSAVLEGFAAAHADLIAVMDADLSHPPQLLPRLVRVLRQNDVDVVVASRYVRGGAIKDWSLWRLILSRVACWLARRLTPARDAMSGFFVLRRDRLAGEPLSARGFKIGLELLVRTRPRAIAEVPYVFVGRTAGKSKMGPSEGLRYLKQLWDLYRYRSHFTANGVPRYIALAAEPLVPATGRPKSTLQN